MAEAPSQLRRNGTHSSRHRVARALGLGPQDDTSTRQFPLMLRSFVQQSAMLFMRSSKAPDDVFTLRAAVTTRQERVHIELLQAQQGRRNP